LEGGAPSNAFNVGTGVPHSVRQVLEAVARVAGRPVPAETSPRRPGDPSTLYASNDRIRTTLGWAPDHASIDDIVASAWRWFDAHPEGYGD
jgi:UDP-glucose 4-epimerase